MKITDYHAAYFAHELTKRTASDSPDRLAGAVASAQVDLNPHQVDAALFAFNSPLARGALLADEVGLGKTIEAGLVVAQKWAQRSRRILVITPANLRKQWQQELAEKFFLPCQILESSSYNLALRSTDQSPLTMGGQVIIVSYQFAHAKNADIAAIPWDLVVLDEAHRLRNVYKPTNVIANSLRTALQGRPKLLLTATPLQNSLLELFGLASVIDEHVFGDIKSFREQFMTSDFDETHEVLRMRLRPICHRTLRRQVTAYVPYTKRLPLVEEFSPDANEERLYEMVSDYLQRPQLHALPNAQRSLMTLVLRKLLASSTFAIAGALTTMAERLRREIESDAAGTTDGLVSAFSADYEGLQQTAEEWPTEETIPETRYAEGTKQAEIRDLETFATLATSIQENAKGRALLAALHIGMLKAAELGAPQKAIIFTESRRTQNYLQQVLSSSPWANGVLLFNGSNTDPKSKSLYDDWLAQNKNSDRVSGSRTADMRSALVDYFQRDGQIMIATEAGAEGINLQFCSLVVNYDLPWNPQRIEQRIGRCHRYGQKHDVVVVNFLNRTNAADQRVFRLLSEKFHLFEGVFGASDEILGSIESGVDFEQRVSDIYQHCRRSDDIEAAFAQLQSDLSAQITEALTSTRRKLLENFDDEVREKLKTRDQSSRDALGRYEKLLIDLTRHELAEHAEFSSDSMFSLRSNPFPDMIPTGRYELPRRSGDSHTYRIGHPLADAVVAQAKARELPPAEISFEYTGHQGKISTVESLKGKSGSLQLSVLTIESLEQSEDYIVFSACTDTGDTIDDDVIRRLFSLPATARKLPQVTADDLHAIETQRTLDLQKTVARRNLGFFEAEVAKLEAWSEDMKLSLERDIKDVDRQMRQMRRASALATSVEEKLVKQRHLRALDLQRTDKRRTLFEAQDQIDRRHEEMIASIESKLTQTVTRVLLFRVRWSVI